MSRRTGKNENLIREELSSKIDNYKRAKDEENKLNKQNKKLNEEIKSLMNELDVDKFESDLFKASVSVRQNEKFDELKAIEVIKDNVDDYSDIIKMKEYVDEDALESAIYNGKISASLLANCKEIGKPIYTLKVGAK